MNFSTVPPCRSTIAFIRSKYRASSARNASGSVDSPSAVDPTTSQNTTVTVLRCSTPGAARGAAHASQKRAPSGFSPPHAEQTCTRHDRLLTPRPSGQTPRLTYDSTVPRLLRKARDEPHRLGVTLLLAAALALGVLGPASARTQRGAEVRRHARRRPGAATPDSLDPTLSAARRARRDLPSHRASSSTTTTPSCSSCRCSPPRCRCSRRTSSATRSSCGKGIQFNDGTPFNAQAVVTTLQRFITYPGSSRASDYAAVDSVTASGPYTVVYPPEAAGFDRSRPRNIACVLSPTQLAKLGDNFATQPGLRRPVHVRRPRRRRPRHRDQVALLLRPEERLPRQDRLQADARTRPRRRRR